MKHSPGPWKAKQDCRSWRSTKGVFTGENPDAQGNQNAWAIYTTETRIALLSEAETWNPQEQVNANAALIAASPTLLAALERILDCPDLNFDVMEPESLEAMDDARKAIAQAKGE